MSPQSRGRPQGVDYSWNREGALAYTWILFYPKVRHFRNAISPKSKKGTPKRKTSYDLEDRKTPLWHPLVLWIPDGTREVRPSGDGTRADGPSKVRIGEVAGP